MLGVLAPADHRVSAPEPRRVQPAPARTAVLDLTTWGQGPDLPDGLAAHRLERRGLRGLRLRRGAVRPLRRGLHPQRRPVTAHAPGDARLPPALPPPPPPARGRVLPPHA